MNGTRGIPSDGLMVPLERAKPGGRKRPPSLCSFHSVQLVMHSLTPINPQPHRSKKETKIHAPCCLRGQVPSKEEIDPLQKVYYKSRGLPSTGMGILINVQLLLYV